MTWERSYQNLQKNGISKEMKRDRASIYPKAARRYGGSAVHADMNGKQLLEIVAMEVLAQSVENKKALRVIKNTSGEV